MTKAEGLSRFFCAVYPTAFPSDVVVFLGEMATILNNGTEQITEPVRPEVEQALLSLEKRIRDVPGLIKVLRQNLPALPSLAQAVFALPPISFN